MEHGISSDEAVLRARMRADLIESGSLCITEIYTRLMPGISTGAMRRIKKEMLDEYLALRHQHFHE